MGWQKLLLLSLKLRGSGGKLPVSSGKLRVSSGKLRGPLSLSLSLSFSHYSLTRTHTLHIIYQIFDGNSPLLPLNL